MYEKYYKNKNVPYTFYAYCPPGCEQGDYIYGQPREAGMATVENFRVYKEVGFNMVESGTVDKDACIMLNITGAGEEAMKMGRELWYLQPSKTFSLTPDLDEVVSYVESLF